MSNENVLDAVLAKALEEANYSKCNTLILFAILEELQAITNALYDLQPLNTG
jgi:Fe-S-cluster formation regulator IscX/YfhJ